MINYDKEIIEGINLLIESWSFEDIEDLSTFSKGMIAGLEVARNYILAHMEGIDND